MTDSNIMIDNERTRVTLWTFKPGEETGQHIHEFDYVVVSSDARLMAAQAQQVLADLRLK